MKRFALLLISLGILSACQHPADDTHMMQTSIETTGIETQATEEETTASKSISEYTDCTVKVIEPLVMDENPKIVGQPGWAVYDYIAYYKDVADLYNDAEVIAAGEVLDVTYCDMGGSQKTFYSFAVTDVLKGGDMVQTETIITIGEDQGYARISKVDELEQRVTGNQLYTQYSEDEKEHTYQVFTFAGEPLVEKDQKYVLFLKKYEESKYVDGEHFGVLVAFMGKYILNEDGYYRRYLPNNIDLSAYGELNELTGEIVRYDPPMTLDEIKAAVADAAQGKKPDRNTLGKSDITKVEKIVPKEMYGYKDCTAQIKNPITVPTDACVDRGTLFDWSIYEYDTYYRNISELETDTDNIVAGEVVDIRYIVENGEPLTCYSFAVSDVMKGEDVKPQTIVTIVERQGYMDYDSLGRNHQYYSVIYPDKDEAWMQKNIFEVVLRFEAPLVKVGHKYVLFLEKPTESDLAEGSYFFLEKDYMGKYILNNDGKYRRFIYFTERYHFGEKNVLTGEYEMAKDSFSLEEMKEILKQK